MRDMEKNLNKIKNRGIAYQIAIDFSVIIAATVIILALATTIKTKSVITNSTLELMDTMTDQSAELISEELQKYMDVGNNLALNRIMVEDNVDAEFKMNQLKSNAEFYGHLSIGIGNIDGEFIFADGGTSNLKERDFFEESLQGYSVIKEPYYSETLKKDVITYSIPVKDEAGSVKSVIVFTRAADEISSLLRKIKFLKTGQAFMVDGEGYVIADNDQSLVTNHVNFLDTSSKETSESLAAVVSEMVKGKDGIGSYEFGGVKKYVSYAPIADSRWSIAIAVDDLDLLSGANSMRNLTLVIGIAILLLTILISLKVAKSLTVDINIISNKLRQMGEGDFTFTIDDKIINRRDEIGVIGRASNELKNSVGNMINHIKELSDDINTSSKEILEFSEELSASTSDISASIGEVSQGNSKQSEELGEIAIQAEEASRKLDVVSEHTNKVSKNTGIIEDKADKSKVIVENMESLIRKFEKEFTEFKGNVEELGDDMNTINSITNIINGISDQTNLLALNAAIEAARAGEMGKGFAVVADEIRVLAEQSKQNAEEITKIIVKSYDNANSIVEKTRDINNGLNEQSTQINNVKEAFDDIAASVEAVIPEMKDVYKEFTFVKEGQAMISGSIESLSAVSEQVAASSEEILASSEELNESSNDLTSLAEKLTSRVSNVTEELEKFKI